MKISYLLLFFISYGTQGFSQSYFSKLFLKEFFNLGIVTHSVEMDDSTYLSMNYLVDLYTNSGYINLEKTSKNGDSIWHKQYGEENTFYESDKVLKIGKSYFLAGTEYLNGQDTGLAFIMKINANGDSLWKKTYSHGANGENFFTNIIATSDGGLLAVGVRKNNENPIDTNWRYADRQGYVVKTDLEGNELWHLIFGDNKHHESIASVVELPGKKYGIAGKLYEESKAKFEGFYYVLDSIGKIIQKSVISINKHDVTFGSIILTKTGNIFISGSFAESETYFGNQQKDGSIVALYNLNGVKKWHKTYLQDIQEAMLQDIIELDNGEIMAVGFTSNSKAYILKLSASGNLIWNRRINHNQGDERFLSGLYDISLTTDGMYLCSGNASYLPDTLTGVVRTMPWLCKVDTNGCVIENCLPELGTHTDINIFETTTAFPNPFSDIINLSFPTDMLNEEVSIKLFDLQGRIVYEANKRIENEIYPINLNQNLFKGVYIIRIENKKKVKLIKLIHH